MPAPMWRTRAFMFDDEEFPMTRTLPLAAWTMLAGIGIPLIGVLNGGIALLQLSGGRHAG